MELSIQSALSTIRADPMLEEAFIKDNGEPYRAGDIMKAPTLGRTLRRIADEGPDTFYSGSLAKDIIDDITDAGMYITAESLDIRSPGRKVIINTMPDPGLQI